MKLILQTFLSFISLAKECGFAIMAPLSIITDNGVAFMDFDDLANSGQDEEMPTILANIWGLDSYQTDWILCRGNFMVDSHRILFTTERLYTNNPTIQATEINNVLRQYMGIDRVVAVSAMHNDYWGHIDMQMKLLNDTIMVISSVKEVDEENFTILEDNAQTISELTAPNGKSYHIARLPKADNWKTYTNSLILYGKVIVPIYNPPNDQVALNIYSELPPNHEVVGINAHSIIGWQGAIHSITMQLFDDGYFTSTFSYNPSELNQVKVFPNPTIKNQILTKLTGESLNLINLRWGKI